MIQIRSFQPDDKEHLLRFLALAAHEDDAQIALNNPNLARYAEGFRMQTATVPSSRVMAKESSASRGRAFGQLIIAVSAG